MSGLARMTQTLAVPVATGVVQMDINRELGLTQAKLIFDQRTRALVDPNGYKNDRNAQFTLMTTAVAKSYADTFNALRTSGMSTLEMQQHAINAAATTKSVQENILESMLPSGSTAVAMQAEGVRSGKFTGMLSAPSAAMSSRAPRRKATRKRK